MDPIRNVGSDNLMHDILVGVNVNQTLVNAHLPVVDRTRPATVGALPNGHPELFRGQGNGARHCNTPFLREPSNLRTERVQRPAVSAVEGDSYPFDHDLSHSERS